MIKFELNEKEMQRAKEFCSNHRMKTMSINDPHYSGAIGGHISYIVTPTSLGYAFSIRCSRCNVEENITDYDCW